MHFLTGALTCYVLHTKSCVACHSSQYSLVLNANVKDVGSWKINSFYTAKFYQISWGFFWQFLQNLSSERCINWNVIPHYRHPLRVGVHRWSGGRMTPFWLCSIARLSLPNFHSFCWSLPASSFCFHFKAYCPFTKASSSFCIVISSIRFQIYHWSLCCPGKDHVCMLANKSWEPDCLCFSAGHSSKGAKRRNGSY